ncbi:MAG: energy transducer TonB [Candidatus Eisenbacteria bacterium]|uniref:Energy transducer TonB n=1 Tax=Eiseniibacteriota bacterium TaxID=2212470 RepID=A0A7Y2E8K6_UNCEI|nr:energy transducer TonB [Candidatus Eisenbacteria bacterium]
MHRYVLITLIVIGLSLPILSFANPRGNVPLPTPDGDFFTRFKANDAPIGGRFTIFAYFLKDLDAMMPAQDGPGRYMLLIFRDSNGKNSFLIPADFSVKDVDGRTLQQGFNPLGEERLGGPMGKDDVRRAVWWIPKEGPLVWETPADLRLYYGFDGKEFYVLPEKDVTKAVNLIPNEELAALDLDPMRSVGAIDWKPDPEAFDKQPEVRIMREPEYPENARRYDFTGTVRVVAHVNEKGTVDDLFLIQPAPSHDLNVAALVAIRDWVFRAGRKDNRKVGGEIIIPIRFAEAENK